MSLFTNAGYKASLDALAAVATRVRLYGIDNNSESVSTDFELISGWNTSANTSMTANKSGGRVAVFEITQAMVDLWGNAVTFQGIEILNNSNDILSKKAFAESYLFINRTNFNLTDITINVDTDVNLTIL